MANEIADIMAEFEAFDEYYVHFHLLGAGPPVALLFGRRFVICGDIEAYRAD